VRLNDLLGADVVDRQNRVVGRVHDVRLVRDGPRLGTFGVAFRIEGLVFGKAAVGARLGFVRASMTGPWAVRGALRAIHGDPRYLPWSRVVALQTRRVVISGGVDDLGAPDEI
jgi:sporulation protein YlmC with PRC-barrel domain